VPLPMSGRMRASRRYQNPLTAGGESGWTTVTDATPREGGTQAGAPTVGIYSGVLWPPPNDRGDLLVSWIERLPPKPDEEVPIFTVFEVGSSEITRVEGADINCLSGRTSTWGWKKE